MPDRSVKLDVIIVADYLSFQTLNHPIIQLYVQILETSFKFLAVVHTMIILEFLPLFCFHECDHLKLVA